MSTALEAAQRRQDMTQYSWFRDQKGLVCMEHMAKKQWRGYG